MARSRRYKFSGTGLTDAEKKWGNRKFKEYEELYSIERLSDLNLLEQLVYLEVIERRYKNRVQELDEYNKNVTDKNGQIKKAIVPKDIREALDENLQQQLIVKEKLGFFQDKNESDFYKHLTILQKKFDIYRQENPLEFKTVCPSCGFIYFLKRRTKDFEPNGLKLFRNKLLLNEEMYKDYKEGKLKKEDYARYIGTDEEFIDWLETHLKDSTK